MGSSENVTTALAVREKPIELWRDPEWQRLWLSLQARPWMSLALVPASQGGPADLSLTVAVTLARTGMMHLGKPIQVAAGIHIPLGHLSSFGTEVERCKAAGERIILALAPVTDSPVAISLAQSCDAALLCIMMEEMSWGAARKTVSKIGASRFLGSVVFRPNSKPPK